MLDVEARDARKLKPVLLRYVGALGVFSSNGKSYCELIEGKLGRLIT